MSLLEQQTLFFETLSSEGETPAEIRGRIGIYRYAYFERIRSSIEEDFPMLFEYLSEIPGGIDAEALTRDLLARNHPHSWTLAEASLPVFESLEALLAGAEFNDTREECFRLARLDEAEAMASWLEEWPESKVPANGRVGKFAEGALLLVRTKTLRATPERVFWRTDRGVESAPSESFERFQALLATVESPIGFEAFGEGVASIAEPEAITLFLKTGISEGWLLLVDSVSEK
jgi:hypothetical protein